MKGLIYSLKFDDESLAKGMNFVWRRSELLYLEDQNYIK